MSDHALLLAPAARGELLRFPSPAQVGSCWMASFREALSPGRTWAASAGSDAGFEFRSLKLPRSYPHLYAGNYSPDLLFSALLHVSRPKNDS